MGTGVNDPPLLQNNNSVSVFNAGKTMCNHDNRFSLRQPCESLLDQILIVGVYVSGKLRQTFRMLYGVSPSEYILNARMQYAQLLLSKPTPSIGAIATHLGYASASKFSIAFRKVYNQSPEEYRTASRL